MHLLKSHRQKSVTRNHFFRPRDWPNLTVNGNITVQRISDRDLTGMEQEWTELLSDSASNNLFLTWHWMTTWWDIFQRQKELFILTLRESDVLIGIAPFYIERNSNCLVSRIIRLCSSQDLYPEYLDIIARNGYESRVAMHLFQYLEEYERHWDIIYFDNVLSRSTIIQYKDYLSASCLHRQEFSSACPYVKLHGIYGEYMRDNFRRKKRYNLHRQIRIALEDANLRLVVVEDEASVDLAMKQLFSLHERRLSTKNAQSTFTSEKVKMFHMVFSRLMLINRGLKLCFLCQGEQAVSAVYAFEYGGRLLFYQSGMDPAWSGRSVGTVLIALLIRQAFDSRLTEFDFLKGDEDYKRTFSNGLRRQYRLVFYKKKSPVGMLRFFIGNLRSCAKRLKSLSQ